MKKAFVGVAGSVFLASIATTATGQSLEGRALLEQAAEAMGGRDRLAELDAVVMTGFGQYLYQSGGGNPSPDPRAPSKWQAANGVERHFDLAAERSRTTGRRSNLFPFAGEFGHSWPLSTSIETGLAALDHPLPALLEALDEGTRIGPVAVEGSDVVVELAIESGERIWLALDNATKLPSWVRWIAPSEALGDVTTTAYFTGYLPFDDVMLPVGITTGIDWRDLTTSTFHVDAYRVDPDDFEPVPAPETPAQRAPAEAVATPLGDGVWDVRIGGNGGAVMEFDDHLVMFEAYGSEAATFARLDLANTLVPGKEVTAVIVSHHHFDHSGGLRAAVARGLTIISRRGNEGIFREMVARPAPNHPDALARDPQPLRFVPVDEHLVLEDASMRVDVYHAVGHAHMAEAVVAYVPAHRLFLEGDFSTYNWDYHWWGDAYLDTVERYDLDPAVNVPVHGRVTTFEETIRSIEDQVDGARALCAANERAGIYMAGCPVKFSRD